MIEKIIYDYMNAEMSVPCYMEEPEVTPEKYVVIEKTGSSRYKQIESATITFQSFAPSLYEAAELNEAVKAALLASTESEHISSATLNSDYNYTDTTTKRYRYQAVFDVVFY